MSVRALYRSAQSSQSGGVTPVDPASRFLFAADPNQAVTVPTQPAYNITSGNYIRTLTPEKVYSWFDQLMDDYPEYISRDLLGRDQSGQFDIFGYKIKFPDPRTQWSTIKYSERRIKIMMETVHNEQINFAYLFQYFRTIANGRYLSSALEALRYNCEYYVIPVGNPWGLANASRPNSRSVDINRNFPAGWKYLEPGIQGSGDAPLSEEETKIIYGKVNEYKPDIYISCHSNGEQKEDGSFITSASLREYSKAFYEGTFRGVCAYGETVPGWLPDPVTLIRNVIYDEPFGTSDHYASSLGAIAGNPEICYWLRESPSGADRGSSEAMTLAVSVFTNTVMACIGKLLGK